MPCLVHFSIWAVSHKQIHFDHLNHEKKGPTLLISTLYPLWKEWLQHTAHFGNPRLWLTRNNRMVLSVASPVEHGSTLGMEKPSGFQMRLWRTKWISLNINQFQAIFWAMMFWTLLLQTFVLFLDSVEAWSNVLFEASPSLFGWIVTTSWWV